MERASPKFIWKKSAGQEWLAKHSAVLQEKTRGEHAVVETAARKRISIEFFCGELAIARELQARFGGRIERLPNDWEARWFAAHCTSPLRVGKRLTVIAEARDAPGDAVLVIPAGVAFGTGQHATTAMSLRLLERLSRGQPDGWRMLDAGTGSGILALAARRFGAGTILAIENDPLAIATARENARANGIEGVQFIRGDVQRRLRGQFHFITANLYSDLLAVMLPQFARALLPGGRLILSGVLREQEAELQLQLRANRLAIEEVRRRGKWIALVARHSCS